MGSCPAYELYTSVNNGAGYTIKYNLCTNVHPVNYSKKESVTFCHPCLKHCLCLAANTCPPTETDNTDIACAHIPAIKPVCTNVYELHLPVLIHLQ